MKIDVRDRKTQIIGAAILAVVIAIAGVLTWWFIVSAKVAMPENLRYTELTNGQIYIQVDKVLDCEGYEFKIVKNGGEPQYLKSKEPIIEVSGYFKGGTYVIQCRALGQVAAGNSAFTDELTYESNVQLPAPTLEFNDGENRVYLTLNENYTQVVDITAVLVYGITPNSELLTLESFVELGSNGHGTLSGYFDVGDLPAGEYNVSAKVITNTTYFKSSILSEQITIEILK